MKIEDRKANWLPSAKLTKRQQEEKRKKKLLANEKGWARKAVAWDVLTSAQDWQFKAPRPKPVSLFQGRKSALSFADTINRKKYRSDGFLKELLEKNGIKHQGDTFNQPLGRYFPDYHNLRLGLIIECHGSIHRKPQVRQKDVEKRFYYLSHGFKVIEIYTQQCSRHYEAKIKQAKEWIAFIQNNPAAQSPKIKLFLDEVDLQEKAILL